VAEEESRDEPIEDDESSSNSNGGDTAAAADASNVGENEPGLKERLLDSFTSVLESVAGPKGDLCLRVTDRNCVTDIALHLRDEEKFNLFVDISAVDYFLKRKPRFDVIYNLYSIPNKHRIFLKIICDADEEGIPSLVNVYRGANWYEREVWDMFGISFRDHPNLKRILMYESFEGHPLRKDYDCRHRQPIVGPKS